MCNLVVLLELDGLDPDARELLDLCCPERRKKIESRRTTKMKKQSLGAELCFLAAAEIAKIPGKYTRLPDGRPVPEAEGMYMSFTHSEKYAACALAEMPVGIDLEQKDRIIPQRMAKWVFASGESGKILHMWVKKESILKRTGEGIRRKMSDFRIFEMDGILKIIDDDDFYLSVSLQDDVEPEIYRFSVEEIKIKLLK